MMSSKNTSNNPNEGFGERIERRGRPAGPPSQESVEARAREIALTEDRSANEVRDEDRRRALSELEATTLPLSTEDRYSDLDGRSNPAEPAVRTGRQATEQRPVDEQQVEEKEIKEGVDEAAHEQMVRGHKNEPGDRP